MGNEVEFCPLASEKGVLSKRQFSKEIQGKAKKERGSHRRRKPAAHARVRRFFGARRKAKDGGGSGSKAQKKKGVWKRTEARIIRKHVKVTATESS